MIIYLNISASTYGESGTQNTLLVADSKTNIKESTGIAQTTTSSTLGPPNLSVGNHLDIPQSTNPNLLSPDMLGQRRGVIYLFCTSNLRISILINLNNRKSKTINFTCS